MSTRNTYIAGLLTALVLLAGSAARAAVQYDAMLEWNGPKFSVINGAAVNQNTDTPVLDIPFQNPFGIALREHAGDGRDVVYVLDSGNNRIQTFEVNATYNLTSESDFTFQVGGTVAASEWDTDNINLAEWAAVATNWVVPFSEVLTIDGDVWTRVDDIAGYTAADMVYSLDYDDVTNAPEIVLPATTLTSESIFSLKYAASDNQTGAAAAFGIGDVDYGIGTGATPVLAEINESTAGGPSTFEQLRSIALIQNEQAATSDDLFVIDAEDATQQLFHYTVTDAGVVTAGEIYEDELSTPWDVAAARSGVSTRATVTPADDLGPFDQVTAVVVDDSQVTGHDYTVTVAGTVTITDATTGRVLVNAAAFADLDDPFLGIPGLSLPLNIAVGVTSSIATTRATIGRYLFVADSGNDRIKVMGLPDVAAIAGGWLASDERTVDAQPAGAGTIGASGTLDHSESTPATVTEDLTFWTTSFPIAEGTLDEITFDPDGTPETWSMVDDLATAGPADQVYEVDWTNGMIRFGDGIHGELPPASTDFEYSYATTPDVLRFGTSGTGAGRFSGPKGVAARWNTATGVYDVYVADTGNTRVQKFAFHPANDALGLDARMEYVTEWSAASGPSDPLGAPVDVVVASDTNSPVDVWVAVVDGTNNRVVLYDDNAAVLGGGTTAPVYDATLGSATNSLGGFTSIAGVGLLANGTDLDVYVADGGRDKVTKYAESPTPSISVTWTDLPDCYPPTGSWSFSWSITNAPSGGYIDFYYDTASTFNAGTAKLLFTAGSVAATATTATWTFASSPAGIPADGTYYIFARVKNGTDNTVATDQTTSTELLCIDSDLLPTMSMVDIIDSDGLLYLQNSLQRSANLKVQYPDSTGSVSYFGTFDATTVEIVSISQGTAFDGIGATNILFDSHYDNTAGTFQVFASALDAPNGLTANGPHDVANVVFRAKSSTLSLETRALASTVAIDQEGTFMADVNGLQPATPRVNDLAVRIAFLGDVAGASGAGGTLPNLQVDPDGFINFQDQMVFALGFNGTGSARDQISDIGPVTGVAPDVISVPDGEWDVDDILAFTTMFSWGASVGISGPSGFVGGDAIGSSLRAPMRAQRPALLGEEVAGAAYVYTSSDVESALPGSKIVVDVNASNLENMNGALVNVAYDPSQMELVSVAPGDLFTDSENLLFLENQGIGWIEITANRLDSTHPGVSGHGSLAQLTFEIKDTVTMPLDVQYDLRSTGNLVLSRGDMTAGPLEDHQVEVMLYSNFPNPTSGSTQIVYSVPSAGPVGLHVFDPSGRRVRSLVDGTVAGGYHMVPFDGRSDANEVLPAGVYFYRLQADGQTQTKKMVITR